MKQNKNSGNSIWVGSAIELLVGLIYTNYFGATTISISLGLAIGAAIGSYFLTF